MTLTILTPEDVDMLSEIVCAAFDAGAISDEAHDEALLLLQGVLHGEA